MIFRGFSSALVHKKSRRGFNPGRDPHQVPGILNLNDLLFLTGGFAGG